MKNLLRNSKAGLLLVIMLLFSATAMAMGMQEDTGNVGDYLSTFPAIVATTLLVTNQFKDWLNLKGQIALIFSWASGLIVVLITRYVIKTGFIMEYDTIQAVLAQGVGVTLVANGVFNINIVQSILQAISFSKNKNNADK